MRVNQKSVVVRSSNRDTGTADDFTIVDNKSVFTNVPKSVRLSSVTLPYTWANVGGVFGNTIDFTGAISGAHTIVIPTNNYDGTTLATQLSTDMSAAAAPDVYTVTYNGVTNKFTIASTENFSIDFTQPNNMHTILGFLEVITPVAMSITSTNVAGFVIDKEVLVCTNLIDGIDNGLIDWKSGPPTSSQAIGFVPIVGPWGGIIEFVNPFDMPFYTITNSDFSSESTKSLTRTLHMWLRFPSGATVDLQGQDWECVIIFDFNSGAL